MNIAVMGSINYDDVNSSFRDHDRFADACRWLGAQIISQGHNLLVGSDRINTVDCLATEGAVDILDPNDPACEKRIKLYRSFENLEGNFQTYLEHKRECFEFIGNLQSRAQGAHLLRILQADMAIMMGGANGTLHDGVAAITSSTNILPIAAFGGTCNVLLNLVNRFRRNSGLNEINEFRGPWDDYLKKSISSYIRDAAKPRVMLIHGRSKHVGALENFLRKTNCCEPFVLEPAIGDTVPKRFEELASQASGAICLATPDDVGCLADQWREVLGSQDPHAMDEAMTRRARQNVWLEYGWFCGKLGADKVMILREDGTELPSDLKGYFYYWFRDDPCKECADDLKRFINGIVKSPKTKLASECLDVIVEGV